MGRFIEVGKTKDYKEGTKKKIKVADKEILLVKAGDNYYAVNNRCPHLDASLSHGKLEGSIITCPSHGSQFDLNDGQVVRWLKGFGPLSKVNDEFKKSHALQKYSVKVEDDTIFIEA